MSQADSSNNPRWFTIPMAAEYLQIGEPTIYRWMREGKLTFRKIGDATRFLKEDLDATVVVHRATPLTKDKASCSVCFSENLIEGKCQSTGLLYFIPQKTKFWTIKTSNIKLTALMCSNCGHVDLAGNKELLTDLTHNPNEA